MKPIRLIFLLLSFFSYSVQSGTLPLTLTGPRTNILVYDDVWTGIVSTDWNDASNWLSDAVPTTTTNVTIGSGASFYPDVTTLASVNNLVIEAGGSLIISGGTLQIAADITNSGTLDASDGTIEMIGSSPQTIPAAAFSNNTVKNLIINSDVTLNGLHILTGTLTVATGKTFATNDNLVLRSDANGTARIDALPVDGLGNATAFITGKISIERYIPMRKAWRLLSVPVNTFEAPFINDAFQEGVGASSLNGNPNPGYGVFVLGGSPAHGFDQGITNNSTIKVFNNAGGNFAGLPANPGTMRPITDYPGYFLYIRGDRGINLSLGNSAENQDRDTGEKNEERWS